MAVQKACMITCPAIVPTEAEESPDANREIRQNHPAAAPKAARGCGAPPGWCRSR